MRPPPPGTPFPTSPTTTTTTTAAFHAAMDPESLRRAYVAFRLKLRRDTGTNLPAADCEALLARTFEFSDHEAVSLHSDPGAGAYTRPHLSST